MRLIRRAHSQRLKRANFWLGVSRGTTRVSREPGADQVFVDGGSALESVVGAGNIISAALVRNPVVSSNVVVDDGAIVEGGIRN